MASPSIYTSHLAGRAATIATSHSRRRARTAAPQRHAATCHGESKGPVLPRVAAPRQGLRRRLPPPPQQRRVHMLHRPSPQAVRRGSRRRPEREAAAHQLLRQRRGRRPRPQHAAHPKDAVHAHRQAPLQRLLPHPAPRAGWLLSVGGRACRRRLEDAANPDHASRAAAAAAGRVLRPHPRARQREAGQAAQLVSLRSLGGGADNAALPGRRPRQSPRPRLSPRPR